MFDDVEESIRAALEKTSWALAAIDDADPDDELHDVWNEVAEAKDCLENALEELAKARKQR